FVAALRVAWPSRPCGRASSVGAPPARARRPCHRGHKRKPHPKTEPDLARPCVPLSLLISVVVLAWPGGRGDPVSVPVNGAGVESSKRVRSFQELARAERRSRTEHHHSRL